MLPMAVGKRGEEEIWKESRALCGKPKAGQNSARNNTAPKGEGNVGNHFWGGGSAQKTQGEKKRKPVSRPRARQMLTRQRF